MEGVERKEAGPLDGASPGVVLDLALVNWNINVDPIFFFIVPPTIYLLNTGHSIWSTCVYLCISWGLSPPPPNSNTCIFALMAADMGLLFNGLARDET